MTGKEKDQLAVLNKRVFNGEELTGQLKDLHDHLKNIDRGNCNSPYLLY